MGYLQSVNVYARQQVRLPLFNKGNIQLLPIFQPCTESELDSIVKDTEALVGERNILRRNTLRAFITHWKRIILLLKLKNKLP